MRLKPVFFYLFIASTAMTSCEFHCSVGSNEEPDKTVEKATTPVHQDGALINNGIELAVNKIKLKKAYLVFMDGEKVPDDNFIDFKQPVKLLLIIDSGWVVNNNKVLLGASEKIIDANGEVLMDKQDMFGSMPDGMTEEDGKIIGLTVTLKLKEGIPPTFFTITFRVWDKNGNGYIEGSYTLYSK